MRTVFHVAIFTLALGVAAPGAAEEAHHSQGAAQTQAHPVPPQVPAPAQRRMGMMGQGDMTGGTSPMMPMMGMMQMMHGGTHTEGRLAFMKAELRITPAQEKAWDEFANAMRQAAAKVRATSPMPMSGMAGNATPPQLLEQHEKQLSAQLEAIRIVKPSLGSFYAGLNEEQKKTFAQLHPILHGML